MSTAPQVFVSRFVSEHDTDCACVDYADQNETDCACDDSIGIDDIAHAFASDDFPPPSLSLLPLPQRWWRAPPHYSLPITDDHTVLLFRTGTPDTMLVVNRAADRLLGMFEQPTLEESLAALTAVEREAVKCLTALGAIQSGTAQGHARAAGQHTIVAWLHLTEECSLRCTYCYAQASQSVLSPAIGLAAIDAIMQAAVRNEMSRVKLKYAGGEPLLNFACLEVIHEYAEKKATELQLELEAVLLTNGVAFPRKAINFLRDHHISIMISLDGLGDVHDVSRSFANGTGSFKHVLRTIKRLRADGLSPTISVTVTRLNCQGLARLVSFLLKNDLRFHLNFYRDHGGCTASDLRPNPAELINSLHQVFEVVEAQLPRRRIIDSLVDRASFQSPHVYPCGVGQNYLVVDTSGGIARCHMEVAQPVSSIWSDDPLADVRAAAAKWHNVPVLEKDMCQDCQWCFWCAGGCPLLAMRAKGRADLPSPYCEVYKTILPDALRLEGLRVLHWEKSLV